MFYTFVKVLNKPINKFPDNSVFVLQVQEVFSGAHGDLCLRGLAHRWAYDGLAASDTVSMLLLDFWYVYI